MWSALPNAETPTVRFSRSFSVRISFAIFGALARANNGNLPVDAKREIFAPWANAWSATSKDVPA